MSHLRSYGALSILSGLLALPGCGTDGQHGPEDGGVHQHDAAAAASFIRIHYRLQGPGDPKSWGVHFWGAGTSGTTWGAPQPFSQTDDFGAYTDVAVTATGDTADAWLGMIPVQCQGADCKKDVETSARFFDLQKSPGRPSLAECWITQGQAIQIQKPTATGPAFKISRPREFIDLGSGSVRLMFRVPPGSTGTVSYGATAATLDKQVGWAATDNLNASGLILPGLTPGTKVYYKISSTLRSPDLGELKDESAVLELTPIAFTTIEKTADWASWGSQQIMYQLIVRTFADGGSPKAVTDAGKQSGIDPATPDGIGDLVGLRSALPYLKGLGADAIWMTPVFRAKSYHGYDTTDFYDIDPAVGTRKDFVDLAAAAHALGIKLILDLVENHVADVNPWFVAAIDPKNQDHAKYRDWFVWADEYTNMLTDKHPFDPSAVIWACKNYVCYHQIFGGATPELNYHNPEVRAEMKKISAFWLDLGADGFRLDASKHIDQFDDNNAVAVDKHGTHVWWKEFNYHVKKGVPRAPGAAAVILAGENRWDDPLVAANMVPYAGDMDSQFDFPFRTYLSNFLTGKSGEDVDFVKYLGKLQKDAAETAAGGNPNHYFERFLSNHDLERPATQFAGLPGPLDALLKQAATIVLTVPGMPVIYYGEEFGKQGKRAKYLGTEPYDHDEFIREPMSWYRSLSFSGDKKTAWNIDFIKTDADNAGLMLGAGVCKAANPDYPFILYMQADDTSSWAAQKDDPASLYSYYKKLVAIRKANPLLTDPASQLSTVQNTPAVYEFKIEKAGQSLAVVLSRMATAQTVNRPAMSRDLISGTTATSFTVPPYGALILQ